MRNEGEDQRPSAPPEFRGTPGPRANWQPPESADGNEAAFLELFLTNNLFERIANKTNTRARAIMREAGENLTKQMKRWTDCTVNEIKKVCRDRVVDGN
jgi:hypothetical protein